MRFEIDNREVGLSNVTESNEEMGKYSKDFGYKNEGKSEI